MAEFGVPGPMEILIILIILMLLGGPAIIVGLVFLVVYTTKKKSNVSGENLTTCPDCGGTVSRLAPACPHCGRQLTPEKGI